MLRHLKHTMMTYGYSSRLPEWAINKILYDFSKGHPMKMADIEYLKGLIKDTDQRYITKQILERIDQIEAKAISLEKWIQRHTDSDT